MNYFDGPKKLGNRHPKFMARKSGLFICLIFAILNMHFRRIKVGHSRMKIVSTMKTKHVSDES